MSLFTELNRRNVFRVAAAYLVFGWLVLQIGDVVFPALGLPEWTITLVTVLLAIGIVPALVFSWVYELTPEGVRKESEIDRKTSITHHTARKLDVFTLLALVGVVAFVVIERSSRVDSAQALPAPAVSIPLAREVVKGSPDEEVTTSDDRSSVAVLPFTSRSTDPEDAFFTDGIHDDLLTQLSKIANLKVISRTSVMEYRETTKKIPEIAGELGVATVMEGAVQRAGDRVRINAQLIDADTDEHLWADTFDRELTIENLFEIQSEIATAIAEALEATLSPVERQHLARVQTDSLEAWEAYRRALRNMDGYTEIEFGRAEVEAERALELDPDLAAAHALLARVHMARFWFYGGDLANLERARQALDTGRSLAPDSPELDIAEAYYHYWGFLDYEAALAALDRAIAVAPNDAELFKVKGYALRRAGRYEASNAALLRAEQLDPRAILVRYTLAETYIWLGRFDESKVKLEEASRLDQNDINLLSWEGVYNLIARGDPGRALHLLSLSRGADPTSAYWAWFTALAAGDVEQALEFVDLGTLAESNWGIYPPEVALTGITLMMAGREDEAGAHVAVARAALEQRLPSSERPHRLLRTLCLVSGAARDRAAADRYCAEALATPRPDRFDLNNIRIEVAEGLAMAGDVDGAFTVLESTLDDPARLRSTLLELDPMLAGLKDDPRWDPLMERIDQP